MSEQQIDQVDLNRAWSRSQSMPSGYETSGDAERVQWAARRVIAALSRLDLEISIARERSTAANSARNAKRSRRAASELAKLRGARG